MVVISHLSRSCILTIYTLKASFLKFQGNTAFHDEEEVHIFGISDLYSLVLDQLFSLELFDQLKQSYLGKKALT